jgi:hypothetical protein
MLAANEVQNSLWGAWRLMTGRADGLRLLDLSVDGFWNSFFALVVALPPLLVSWTSFANQISPGPELFAERLGLMPRLAIIDFCTWVVPFVGLAAIAKYAGLSGRFVHYVVAINWANAIIAWMMVPPALISLFFPSASDMASFISLAIFLVSMLFTWQLTNATLNRGPAIATAVFVAMFLVSVVVLVILQSAFGLSTTDSQMPG